MKVLMINSSRSKGNTVKILELIKNEMISNGHKVDILNLRNYQIKCCTGCERCIHTDICSLQDDVNELMKKFEDYDGIVLSSPVFMGQVTGLLKSFIDRTCKWFHRPVLVGKPALVVSTTAGSGLKNTTTYMKEICNQWGMAYIGTIKKSYKDIPYQLNSKDKNIIRDFIDFQKSSYKPSINQLIQYQVQKVLALKVMEIDRAFWEKNNWNKQVYYYSCNINTFKKFIANSFYKLLYKKINIVKEV